MYIIILALYIHVVSICINVYERYVKCIFNVYFNGRRRCSKMRGCTTIVTYMVYIYVYNTLYLLYVYSYLYKQFFYCRHFM